MRSRRPEQFLEADEEPPAALDKTLLEYKLETLTSRSEEKQFEHFARKLAERLICPNLIPQTGPTGGGDSKVDTETYPVDEAISERWYEGNAAGQARWAFAISAKKVWQGKVRSDIKSIAETGRGYEYAYFISSQFISDKNRAKFEDELTKTYGLKVRILDRSWLIEAVLGKACQDVAIQTLGFEGLPAKATPLAPSDQLKAQELEALEAQIGDQHRYVGVEYQLAEDSLSAAILSRELERPRHETEGRFERAKRLAEKYGNRKQVVNAIYQKAWTAMFWYDEFEPADQSYDEVEAFGLGSQNIEDVEWVVTLWQCLRTASITERYDHEQLSLEARADRLATHLRTLSKDQDRPNNAANSKGLLIMLQIMRDIGNERQHRALLIEFGDLLSGSQHLGGFQFDRFVEVLEVMEAPLGLLEEYDQVWEKVLPVIEQRRGEAAVGDKLLMRGIKKLDNRQFLDAIELLGRALPNLIKQEREHQLVRCLIALSVAYFEVGLFWAAHSNLLSAANFMLKNFERTRKLDPLLLLVFDKLFWIEISLGRVPHAIWYLQMAASMLRQIDLDEDFRSEWEEAARIQDGILAMLILKADREQITHFAEMLHFFDEAGLYACALSLLFSVGGPEALRKHEYLPDTESDQSVWDFFKTLWDQPAQKDLPERIETFEGAAVTLVSHVLGIEWEVACENNTLSVRIAESFLSFFEAFLATSIRLDASPMKERVRLKFELDRKASTSAPDSGLRYSAEKGPILVIVRIDANKLPTGGLHTDKLREFFRELLGYILPRVLVPRQTEQFLETIAGVEGGFGRAMFFADVLASSSNLFDESASPRLEQWKRPEASLPITADPPCNLALQSIASLRSVTEKEPAFGTGPAPKELIERIPSAHRKQRVLTKINIELWDKAGWSGVLVALYERAPPLLGLMFRDREAAVDIFEEWRSEIGQVDENDSIRLSILTGVNRLHPSSYTVLIGANHSGLLDSSFDRVFMMSRIHNIPNPNPKNLEMFRNVYSVTGSYYLAPVLIDSTMSNPEIIMDVALLKRLVEFKEAWTVGLNDPDSVAIQPDCEPLIPDEHSTDAPVLEVLQRLEQRRRASL